MGIDQTALKSPPLGRSSLYLRFLSFRGRGRPIQVKGVRKEVKKVSQEKIIKKTKRRVIYSCLLAFVAFLRLLPRRAALSMMRGLGGAAFYLLKSKRLRTLKHLTAAFGHEKSPSDIRRIAKQVFSNFGAFAADAVLIPRLVGNGIHKMITAEGLEHLDNLSRSNEGAILLTAHFGNWELLAAWAAKQGYKLKVIVAPQTNPYINRLIADMRRAARYESIERGNHTREILRALAKGYSIGVLIDEDTKVDGVFVRFFNQWAHTPVGPVRLALKYGLKIIPLFIYLRSDDTYRVVVKAPLSLVVTGDKSRDLLVNAQECSDAYEAVIREHPGQWLWVMRRWKTQPKGETLEACLATIRN
jgi:Kdo2-lipid IVA lauroyltransferase/acyltransferase